MFSSSGNSAFNAKFIKSKLESRDEEEALFYAFHLLNIDADSFQDIHTQPLKKEFLLYKFLYAEYLYSKPDYEKIASELHPLIDKAYQVALHSSMMKNEADDYSPFSIGLSELDMRTVRQQGKEPSLEQSIIEVGPKKGGVEPGFEAIHAQDVLMHLYHLYPAKEDRLQAIKAFECDMVNISKAFDDELPKYMVKLNYKELQNKKVIPDKKDLGKAQAVKDAYEVGYLWGDLYTYFYQLGKATFSVEKNCEAVREVLANDIARFFMSVQHQTLLPAKFSDGSMQLLLKGELIKGATTLAPLSGDTKSNKYRVKKVILPQEGVQHLSDHNITSLAEKLPILLIQNDRDAIGSNGQNKLCQGEDFFAIDFGHAYEATLSLNDLTDQFHTLNTKFKNYSVFYDSPRSEIVRGLLRVAAIAGHTLDPSILHSYGEAYANDLAKLIPHADEKVFDDYIKKFTAKRNKLLALKKEDEVTQENILCCEKIIETVKAAKEKHVAGRDQLLDRFKSYLSLPSQVIDLLENIEKLSTPADQLSLRSPDQSVLLNHLRLIDPVTAKWGAKAGYNNESFSLTGSFGTELQAQQALATIDSFFPFKTTTMFISQLEGKKLTCSFKKEFLPALSNMFNEDKIKQKFFKKDVDLFNHFKEEAELLKLLETFKKYGFDITVSASEKQTYFVTCQIANKTDPLFTHLFDDLLRKHNINGMDDGKTLTFFFEPSKLPDLHRDLLRIEENIVVFKNAYEEFSSVCHSLQNNARIKDKLIVAMSSHGPEQFRLELLNLTDDENLQPLRALQRMMEVKKFTFDKENNCYIIPYNKVIKLNVVLVQLDELYQKLVTTPYPNMSNNLFSRQTQVPKGGGGGPGLKQ